MVMILSFCGRGHRAHRCTLPGEESGASKPAWIKPGEERQKRAAGNNAQWCGLRDSKKRKAEKRGSQSRGSMETQSAMREGGGGIGIGLGCL